MAPPLPNRPVVVRVSSSLLAAAAILLVTFAVSSAWWYYLWSIAYEEEVAADAVVSESFEGLSAAFNYGFAAAQVAAAAALIGLARSNLRGSRPARNTTWWTGGV